MGDGRMKTTHIVGSNVECRQHSVDIGTHKSVGVCTTDRACCSIHLKHKFHVIRRLHGCRADNFIYRHIL